MTCDKVYNYIMPHIYQDCMPHIYQECMPHIYQECMQKKSYTVDREIFVLKIICALKFHGAKFS